MTRPALTTALLGLKGTMAESELHFLRARMQGGLLAKARRGELKLRLQAAGYDTAGITADPTPKSAAQCSCSWIPSPPAGPRRGGGLQRREPDLPGRHLAGRTPAS